MPGSDLDLDLPGDGETFVSFAAKVVAALQAIQADLEPRIGAGALDIDSEVSMNGAPLTNVGGVRLQNGQSDVVGTIYMDEELHAVTSAGDVQITANGTLAITALGVIGGDYGGSNPAEVTFHDSDGSYWFKEDPSTWSDIFVKDIILNGAAGTIRLSVAAGLSGDQEVSFASLPADTGVLIYKASDSTLNQNSTTRADNFRAVDVDITGKLKFTDRKWMTYHFDAGDFIDGGSVSHVSGPPQSGLSMTNGAADTYLRLPTIPSEYKVTKIEVVSDGHDLGTITLMSADPSDGSYSNVTGAVNVGWALGLHTLTPTTPDTDLVFRLKCVPPAAGTPMRVIGVNIWVKSE